MTAPLQLSRGTALSDVLADVVHAVPYSSVSPLYEYFGDASAPAHFGMACAWQTFEVGARVHARGMGSVDYARDNRHVAAIGRSAGRLEVLDPYLLHREVLSVPAEAGGSASVDALPVRKTASGERAPARLRATRARDGRTLQLFYSRFSPARQRTVLARFFSLDLVRLVTDFPPPEETVRRLLLHPEQNNLGVRVVDAHGEVRELVYPLADALRESVHPSRLVARDNQGRAAPADTLRFRAIVSALGRTLGCSAGDVADFVLGGVHIYVRVAPAGIALAPYSTGDE